MNLSLEHLPWRSGLSFAFRPIASTPSQEGEKVSRAALGNSRQLASSLLIRRAQVFVMNCTKPRVLAGRVPDATEAHRARCRDDAKLSTRFLELAGTMAAEARRLLVAWSTST